MRLFLLLALYRAVLPLLFLTAFPGWLVKMIRRGGLKTPLAERVAIYTSDPIYEPLGQVHFHAVSVGETLLAIKIIHQWRLSEPERKFVIATGTATGFSTALGAALDCVRVTYAPLDFPWMVRRYLMRFEPSQIVLIEGDLWPHLLLTCHKKQIPVRLVNARMSPRSARRYLRLANLLQPVFSTLVAVAIQEQDDAGLWTALGVDAGNIHHTGSLKFDPNSGTLPQRREDFQILLDRIGIRIPVILAASTHPDEEAWRASAIYQAAPHALPIMVPRHAERREQVAADLAKAGFMPVLRSEISVRQVVDSNLPIVFVVDSTGELRDWTANADVVIIGKSFLVSGGQNPCEAILANKPVIFGPRMENFEPLASDLVRNGGALCAASRDELITAIRSALDSQRAARMTETASRLLEAHKGATERIVALLGSRPVKTI